MHLKILKPPVNQVNNYFDNNNLISKENKEDEYYTISDDLKEKTRNISSVSYSRAW